MLKGRITIGRYTSNKEPDKCYIQIEDELSGTRFLEIRLTPEALGLALTGLSYLECEFELNATSRVGQRREQKSEIVTIKPPLSYKDNYHQMLRDASVPFQEDGWLPMIHDGSRIEPCAKLLDAWNYKVTFVRWVDIEEVSAS